MEVLYVVIGVVVLLLLMTVTIYNKLVKFKNRMQ
jgi:hypothetical protein